MFGLNQDVDLAAEEDIWDGGGTYTGFDSASFETVEVFSSDANDTAAGTGARTVTIFGVTGISTLSSETLTLNGVTAVEGSVSWLHVYRVVVTSAGSGGSNAGVITCRHTTTTTTVFSQMIAGYNESQVAAFLVPSSHKGYLMGWHAEAEGEAGVAADVGNRLLVRPEDEVWQVKDAMGLRGAGSSRAEREFFVPDVLDGKTQVRIASTTDTDNTALGAGFTIVLQVE